jgi:hypothetical protein
MNMVIIGLAIPSTSFPQHETKKILKALIMDYKKIDCYPKGCLLFQKVFVDD